MDPNTQRLLASSAGGGEAKTYIEDVFSTWLYAGNGSTQTITNGIDLAGKGGLVWIKGRSGATGHRFTDTARTATKSLASDSTAAEVTESTGLTAFNANGFSLGADADYSTNAATYASWTFRKAAKFFDVVTYAGTGANRTIAHNLGSAPGCIIIKRTDTLENWVVYHRSLATNEYLSLDRTIAKQTSTAYWNNTAPTSSVFSLGTESAVNNAAGTYVAYLFAHDAGGFGDSGNDSVVSCGSYTGNGGTQSINLGWEPQWLLVKCSSSSTGPANWVVIDDMRKFAAPGSGDSASIYANLSSAELAAAFRVHATSTGFAIDSEASNIVNGSGQTYIYIAIRRGPMKTPTDATKVFSAITASSDATGGTTNFPVDWLWMLPRAGGAHRLVFSRLTGAAKYLKTSSTDLENTGGSLSLASNTSFTGPNLGTSGTIGYEAFRRAPGFFDVVAYTGTGANRTVSHNLGVAPELMITKQRSAARDWLVLTTAIDGSTDYLLLNATGAKGNYNVTAPTSSVFTLIDDSDTNAPGGTYIAYLFATCPGVSKVGSYTGTGTTLSVDCGFTNGARFILIKRTDSTGDWYVWDTARGIIAANDPYLLLNSTAAEVTNTDYIDPLSSGFQISSTAPAAINANGGSFIFLAVA